MRYQRTWRVETMDMGGAPPHTDTLIRSAASGQGQIGLFKTTRQSQNAFFVVLLDSLASPSNARKVDLEAGPLDSCLENQPSEEVQDRAKAVTSRNQQRNDAFISTQTQHQPRDSNTAPRWRHATATRASRVSQSNTWKPTCETRQRIEPAYPTESKYQTEPLFLTELVNLIWMQ